MKAPPEFELLLGVLLVLNGIVTIWAAAFRPKLLSHWLLRPRWFGAGGPRAGRVGATFGALVWLGIGLWLVRLSVSHAS